MDNWQAERTSLVSRASYILNKDLFSDVQFLVGPDSVQYPAHKLLLSLASPVFQERFQGSSGNQGNVRVPDAIPIAFFKMLKYIYTDTLELDDMQDADDVLTVADKFKIQHLQLLCQRYISERHVAPENAIKMHAIACDLQMPSVIKLCCCTFAKKTEAVLRSKNFLRARFSTIKALMKCETLSTDEYTLLNAVVQWGKAECLRLKIPKSGLNIRKCLDPVIKYARFLTLSIEEMGFVSQWDILSSGEIFAITLKLSSPSFDTSQFPLSLCHKTEKRCRVLTSNSTNITSPKKIRRCNSQPKLSGLNLVETTRNELSLTCSKVSAYTPAQQSSILESSRSPPYTPIPLKSELLTSFCSETAVKKRYEVITRKPHAENKKLNGAPHNFNAPDVYMMKGESAINNCKTEPKALANNVSFEKLVKSSESESDSTSDNESDLDGTSTLFQYGRKGECRAFNINLLTPNWTHDSIRNVDVDSSVHIKMESGSIRIIGLTVKLKNSNYQQETVIIIVQLSKDMCEQSVEQVFEEPVSDNIHLILDNPFRLSTNESGTISVSVESIQLHQCLACHVQERTLKDRNVTFHANLSGNQKKHDEFLPYLIDKILFTHC